MYVYISVRIYKRVGVLLFAILPAPACTNSEKISLRACMSVHLAAECRGVSFRSLTTLTSAPCSIKRRTTPMWPLH